MATLQTHLADFGLDLLRDVGLNSSNAFLSPLSITIALAMCLAGSGGTTKNQLKSIIFGHNIDDEAIQTAFGEVMNDSVTLAAIPTSHRFRFLYDDVTRLYVANQLFASKRIMAGQQFKQSYLDRLHKTYKLVGELPILDYGDSANAAKVINNWVANQTNKKIKDLVSQNDFNVDTIAVLVNAIYFRGKWLNVFPKDLTSNEKFYKTKDSGSWVPMMQIQDHFQYYTDPNGKFNLALLPYSDSSYYMFVILPTARDGVNDVLNNLHGDQLLAALNGAQWEKLNVWLPKFKLESAFHLKATLKRLGVTSIFQNADFSGMATVPIVISDVQHKAVVEVDEDGTEAAAATAVIGVGGGAPNFNEITKDFKVDHPFLFGIWEKPRNQTLFIGKVTDPKYQ